MTKKHGPKFKARRPLSSKDFRVTPKRVLLDMPDGESLDRKAIERAFPDINERRAYVQALSEKMTEPSKEHKEKGRKSLATLAAVMGQMWGR